MEFDQLTVKVRNFRKDNPKHIKLLTKQLKVRAKEEGEDVVNFVNAELRCFFSAAAKNFITTNGVKKAIEVANNVPNPTNFAALVQSNLKREWLQNRYLDSVAYDLDQANTETKNTGSKVDNNFHDADADDWNFDDEPVKTNNKAKSTRAKGAKSKKKSTKKTSKSTLHRIEGVVTQTSRDKIKELAKIRKTTQKEVVGQILDAVLTATSS